jgi:hypothetical protein
MYASRAQASLLQRRFDSDSVAVLAGNFWFRGDSNMTRTVRTLLLLVAVGQFLMAIAFFLQLTPATALWPFPGTTPLTYIFVASIFAAVAAATLWAAAAKQYGALAGIGLDYIAILIPAGILATQLFLATGSQPMLLFVILCVIGVLMGGALLLWSLRQPLDQSIPLPGPVRWSFVVFILALLAVSAQLILQVPNILPWKITPELSVVIGWMFLGAMTYFVYGLLRPTWANAAGQLAGFLAYDLVLVVPFLLRLPIVAPEHRFGLWIYTAVVVYSGVLAIYYLFVNPRTRIWSTR